MKVKVERKYSNEGNRKYPYIGESERVIVYFWAPRSGVVLKAFIPVYDEGYSSINWDETVFKVLEGNITLEND